MDLLRSLPIGLYLEQPITWLHRIDARVKLGWLLTLMLTPISANPWWRLSLVGWLLLFTLATRLPFRVWKKQMGLVLFFSLLLFTVTLFAPDGLTVPNQSRLPADEFVQPQGSPPAANGSSSAQNSPQINSLPQPTNYRYVLFERGNIRVTRRSVELAVRVGTFMFVLIYSTNLYLLTTAPEEITAGLEDLMQPLRRFNVPVTEIVLTLTLSLRFIPLVLEEVQNLVRSVRTRAINWKKIGFRGSTQVWSAVAEKLVDNLLVRAEQIASAMQVRGFTSPDRHQVQWHQLKLGTLDWVALGGIAVFWIARFAIGG
ncbi:energy-coupling factor transporter transmembrane component T family protein [Leptolyngbya ohadii]|uniref:energy-coupling factor transporter transmembrane component T family protein n=1 Tax=Leptolyngbya ohadii TaxID=1962290 RepID=UPI000B59BB17|nr:energy-coupling factor transporter transmembrane protein EcfT [Leptolyngbya ohadii]